MGFCPKIDIEFLLDLNEVLGGSSYALRPQTSGATNLLLSPDPEFYETVQVHC